MTDPSQLGFSLLSSQLALVAMGILSLGFFLSLRSKSLAIRRLPRNLSVDVFYKTFNVFDPYPDRRRMIQGSIVAAIPFFTLFGAIILSFVVIANVIKAGLLLASLTLALCAALMTLEEAFEIYSNAGILTEAVKNGIKLGTGDLTVLFIVRDTLPKLKRYYLSLAIIFFISSIAFPYALTAAIFVLARFVTAPIESAPSQGILAIYYPVLLLVVATLAIQFTAAKIKSRIFGLPQPWSLTSLGKPFELMKQWVFWHMHELAHRMPPEPDEAPDSERRKE